MSFVLMRFKKKIQEELGLYWRLIQHKRTPRFGKLMLGLAIGYAVLPLDIIPDFIPVLGQLDDAIIIPILFFIAWQTIPKDVIEECRKPKDVKMSSGGYLAESIRK